MIISEGIFAKAFDFFVNIFLEMSIISNSNIQYKSFDCNRN